jgi:hypothetical protein
MEGRAGVFSQTAGSKRSERCDEAQEAYEEAYEHLLMSATSSGDEEIKLGV